MLTRSACMREDVRSIASTRRHAVLHSNVCCRPLQVGATIRQGGRPDVPIREALPGPDTAGWAGLDAYVQLMR